MWSTYLEFVEEDTGMLDMDLMPHVDAMLSHG
jgi:hypothetical protein